MIYIYFKFHEIRFQEYLVIANFMDFKSIQGLYTCSQNRQSTKFQNHENINFVEKLYFFILYNQVFIVKHDVKSLHSGFIFRENTSRLTDGFDIDYLSIHGSIIFCI